MPRLPALVLPLLAVLALAGCGGGDEDTTPSAPAKPEAPAPAATQPSQAATGADRDLATKPAVRIPSGDPPRKIVVKDIVEGKGPAAKPGDTLTVQYVGKSFSTGQEFDASWDRGQPFTFQLGSGMVIPGWDDGLEGMKAGGRRELVIPPDLGYGSQGSPPAIAPDETLVFVIDLVKIG